MLRAVPARVVILGAGFAGSYVARELERTGVTADVTLVDPHNFMLYTPLLPETASGSVEPRHTVVPVRMMCPGARLLLGRATAVDWDGRRVHVEPVEGPALDVEFDHLVVALGAVTRTAPIPGLEEHAVGFKSVAEAMHLHDQVLEQLELASGTEDAERRERLLTFVFVGGGYAGVEALAELEDMTRDAIRWYPRLAGVRRRWVLVDLADRLLPQLGGELGMWATRELRERGVEIRLRTSLAGVDAEGVTLSDGTRIQAATVVWTAGVRAHPLLGSLGLELDEGGRVRVDACLRVPARERTWALGDAAAVPNRATPGRTDPPTCQHALRQARALAKNLAAAIRGDAPRPYGYRMLGQVATLGRHKGVAEVLGVPLRGFPGWWFTRTYHLYQLPLASRKLRVVSDWTIDLLFRRDVVELRTADRPRLTGDR
jgi:NADH dehydrogenase